MKRVVVALACCAAFASTAVRADSQQPTINVRVVNGAAAGSQPSLPGKQGSSSSPVFVTGNSVTVTDLNSLVVSIDGAAPAVTTSTLQDASGNLVGTQTTIGMQTDQPVTAAVTSGGANFLLSSDQCSGSYLAAPGTPNSTCELWVTPQASRFGAFTGSVRLANGSFTLDVPLSAAAQHFDPVNLTVAVVAGTANAMNIDGGFKASAQNPAFSAPVTIKVTNNSTEYATPPLQSSLDNGQFLIVAGQDNCTGQSLPTQGSCTLEVEAEATTFGSYAGNLHVIDKNLPGGDPDIDIPVALAGVAQDFDPPRFAWTVMSGNPTAFSVTGPNTATATNSAPVVLELTNQSAELSSGTVTTGLSSTGVGSFSFVSNGCSGQSIGPGANCSVSVQATAAWWGNLAGTLTATSSTKGLSLVANQTLSGTAQHFDPPHLALSTTSGNPAAMNITGWAQGVAAYSANVTVLLKNTSTEQIASAINPVFTGTTPGNLYFSSNNCLAANLAPAGTCQMVVGGQATANGSISAVLQIKNANQPTISFSGTAAGFYTYAWNAGTWSACTVTCGGGTQSRTIYCMRSDGANEGTSPNVYPGCASTNEPAASEACNTGSCCTPNWVVTNYGSCIENAGQGQCFTPGVIGWQGFVTDTWNDGCGNTQVHTYQCSYFCPSIWDNVSPGTVSYCGQSCPPSAAGPPTLGMPCSAGQPGEWGVTCQGSATTSPGPGCSAQEPILVTYQGRAECTAP